MVRNSTTPKPEGNSTTCFPTATANWPENPQQTAILKARTRTTTRSSTGTGEVVSTPGGVQSVSVMRFLQPSITIHAGETVEWNSLDVSGHAITFGQEPPNLSPSTPPSANVFTDLDGARHAIVSSTADNVHSGLITQAPQERTGVAQPPPGATRFRVTFPAPGAYRFKCPLHDQLGMTGVVLVLP